MKTFIVDANFVKAPGFRKIEDLPVPFYADINWDKYVDGYTPKRNFKLFKRLPSPFKAIVECIDGLRILDKLDFDSVRVAIITAGKLERERDEVAFKAAESFKKVVPADGFILTHNGLNFTVAHYLGIRFYHGLGVDHVCSSGCDILGIGRKLLLEETADVCILVTINSMASVSRCAYHAVLKVVSKSGRIKPFDVSRDGTIFADGLCVAVMVKEDICEKIGCSPLFEVCGYGMCCDSYHMYSMDEEGRAFEYAVLSALSKANVKPSEVEVVKAHATGTVLNDRTEAKVYGKLFGKDAVVTALKGVTGHTVTASGLLELVMLGESLKRNIVPKVVGLEELDKDCSVIDVALDERVYSGGYVVSVSAGFGGFYSAVVVKGVR